MSLTTDVTPFESPVEVASVPPVDRPRDLSTEEEDALLAAGREQRLRDGLRIGRTPLVRRATLRMAQTETLVRIAERDGFRLEPSKRKGRQVLSSATGDRIVLSRGARGGVRIHSSGAPAVIGRLVREHSRERAVEYLRRSGFAVEEAQLPNGEIQILALRGKADSGGNRGGDGEGGPAQVAVQVRSDGTYVVDVDRTQGTACAHIVHGLVEATEGQVVATDLKPAYHTPVSENASPKVRV
jgi:hypothetical protein